MRDHLAEDVLAVTGNADTDETLSEKDLPENLSASVRFLEVTSLLVALFKDCHRPIHYMNDAMLDSIKKCSNLFYY